MYRPNPDVQYSNKRCPIYAAILNKDFDMVKILIEYGVKINISPSQYNIKYGSPLELAKKRTTTCSIRVY